MRMRETMVAIFSDNTFGIFKAATPQIDQIVMFANNALLSAELMLR